MRRTVSYSSCTQRTFARFYFLFRLSCLFPTRLEYAISIHIFQVHKQQQHSSKKLIFSCELCHKTCPNQLKFFEHLKSHYEPGANVEDVKTELSPAGEQEFELTPEIESSVMYYFIFDIIIRSFPLTLVLFCS